MHSPKRIKITDVNPHLICVLCGGYYIDATTIIECLHSFCKSCIVRYLQKHKYCPICDVQVHKSAPLINIRSDKTLQNIVYKLVPSLFKNEMDRRVAFYEKYPGAKPVVPEQRGEITDSSPIFIHDEFLMVCLEYQMEHSSERVSQVGYFWPRRYFNCPAALTVSHLVKLIRGKFGLTNIHHVSLFFKDDLLQEDITIMDIAYTYQCRRKIPIHLMFRILELKKKTIKLMPPIPPSQLETAMHSKQVEQREEGNEKFRELSQEHLSGKDDFFKENNNEKTILAKTKDSTDLLQKETHNNIENNTNVEIKNDLKQFASDSTNMVVNPTVSCSSSGEFAAECKNDNKNCALGRGKIETKEESSADKANNNGEKLKECTIKPDEPSSSELGANSEGEWKEVQLQISENGVMSVRNMKSSECSPIPAVEAPNCPVSHPTTSQANSSVLTSKLSFATVPQNRNTEPIVSVSKVSKDQVKKDINPVVTCENKLSISRVTSPATAALPIAKGDVLNRIVSKLSPNETVIGNTGVTIRPVTKGYSGMKPGQERKSRGTSNHIQSRYKTMNQAPSWNPSIDRTTMLSLKQNCDKPARFFKMRNTPRYLGNPAEGVKPIYGGGRQEDSPPKPSPAKSPVKQPPPYTPRGQDKPPPPYTPRPAHTGCGTGTTYLPHNPYHLLYSGFPFAGASPELLRSMCASTAYHPSLPPSISMLYNNPLQQAPQRSQLPLSHDFKVTTNTPPSIQRIPSSLSPKPPPILLPLEEKKRDLPPASTSSSSSLCSGSFKTLKSLEDKPTLLSPLPIIPLPPPPHSSTDKSSTSLTSNNNTKESPFPASINQHSLK